MDTPLDNLDMEVFTDGSSFVRDEKHKAGYTMVSGEHVSETRSLPQGTSAQLAELVALTRALELSKGQRVNIYTDSKYAYLTLHAHAAIWKERQFNTATGEPMKHFREIERLLTVYIVQLLCIAKDTAGMAVKQPKVISWLTVKPEKWHFMKPLHFRRL